MTERAPKHKVPESGVLKACLDLLAAERIWHMRMNTGAMKIGKRFTRFGRRGTADILASPVILKWYGPNAHGINEPKGYGVRGPVFLWLECKSDSGRQTKEQKKFESEISAEQHYYLLVRDVDTLRNWLKENGVIK